MASESLATLSNISNGMFAGGAVAFGVAALVLNFVRRTKKKVTQRIGLDDPDRKRRAWRQELGHDLKNVWATARRRDRREELYVNPGDVWEPSDLERGLERIPGPPSILEMDVVDKNIGMYMVPEAVATEPEPGPEPVKLEPADTAEMDISPTSSTGPSTTGDIMCPYPNCGKTFAKQYDLNHHTRYHDKTKHCRSCDRSFATLKDLNRHVKSKHTPKEFKRMYHCTIAGCKNSKHSVPRLGFDRKDNWKRHMLSVHGKGQDEMVALEREAMDVDGGEM